ncbi:DUF3267 domain-containing protein [Evansella sp. AB-P1]|uniref:DUF3267 domain-containing protein n=1 Tax=Evansella sp. AB-P1 TaxID=3037653 RepID=UPI00241F246A|nr:DUF3267 domain-containing protein [Evansella sp. AB-P1]MDG5786406.1 DUF3267 domain-containing protein [Evansella sp. AB-P1]
MNCWKTISIENQFGKEKLWMISALISILYFIFHFVILSAIVPTTTYSDHGLLLLIIIFSIIPVHLLLHCIPIWLVGKKATFGYRRNQWPYFYFSTKEAIPKQLLLLSISLPALTITGIAIILSLFMPEIMHYLAIAAALNIGICVCDFLYLIQLKSAPREAYIEEHSNGYHILCPKTKH